MGQRWYAANCRQEYGTGKLELTWSRGGRAATVAALAALAFFGGTGRLREPSAAQPGFGLDNNLASMVGDLQARLVGLPTQDAAAAPNEPAEGEPGAAGSEPAKTAAAPPAGRPGAPAAAEELRSFDDRPFNFALEHGDVLIWLGQKPFADTRFALYHHRDLEQNLLATHQRVRSVMRPIAGGSLQGSQRSGGSRAGGVGGGVSAEDERLRRQLALESRKTWREVLDRYGVTHLLVRLSAGGSASAEYGALCDLMSLKPADFELTDLGAGCAVLYRTDLENPELQEFLKERAVDFKQLAFQTGGTFLAARSRWVQSPSFYQRYLWSQRREISPAIQQSLQYVRMATLPIGDERGAMPSLPSRYLDSRAALALMAVRKAQEGLQDDPDSFWGYRVLGEAYAVLGLWEANYSTAPSRAATGGLRYFQSIAAFNQALVAEPEALDVHELLAGQYARANRIDLELRHQQKMYDILKPLEAEIDAEQMLSLEGRIRELKKKVAAADEADLQYQQQGLKPLERAIQLAQQGFVLKAVAALTEESEQRTGNLGAEQLRIVFQQEAGQVEEAYMNAETFAPAAQESRQSNWQDPVAFANLAHADYPRAQTLWSTKADDVTRNALWSLLTSSVPRPAGLDGWPVATARSTASWYLQRPEVICDARLSIALILLEQGQLASAQREFEQALAANPESPSRNLILYYLGQLRGSEEGLDDFPPSQTVPGLFATGEEFEQRGPIVNEDDLAAGE
jgi:tetratricopeptide (TPR) repeat protein